MFSHIPAARWGEEEDGGSESSPWTAGECFILAGGGSPVLFQAVPRGAGGAEHPPQLRIWRQRRSRGAGGGLQGCSSSSNKRLRRAPSCPGNSGCLPFPQLSPTSAGAPQLLSARLGQRGLGREGTRRMGMTPWLDRRQQGGLVGRSDTSQAGPQLQGRPHPISSHPTSRAASCATTCVAPPVASCVASCIPHRIPCSILQRILQRIPRCILHPTPQPTLLAGQREPVQEIPSEIPSSLKRAELLG